MLVTCPVISSRQEHHALHYKYMPTYTEYVNQQQNSLVNDDVNLEDVENPCRDILPRKVPK